MSSRDTGHMHKNALWMVESTFDVINWNDEADLVVVGLGGAGIAAANEALDQGHSVIGIDKTSGGGATARSGGIFYAGQECQQAPS